MPKAEYLAFVSGLLSQYAEKGETVVIAADAPIGKADLEKTEVVSSLSLAVKEGGKFSGGIILEGKSSDKRLDFVSIVRGVRESTEATVAARLFSENNFPENK